ncbi:MAG: acyl-CoA N-acyltransferase [candidate division WOR-3 bacterium]|nr:acyl-CoA N-acyltransferase [candidate division WOR-3 bacterium]
MVQIAEVKTPAQLKAFINFPWKIYVEDPNWVPPLKREVSKLLDQKRHPFWEHARRSLFLAQKNGELVGRISVQVDDNYNRLWNEKLGSFGFFECRDDQAVANALFDAGAEWLKKQGMNLMRGPMSPSSNDEWGFLIEDFDQPPVLMMPYNPPYYLTLAENYGFRKAKDLLAFIKYASTAMPDRLIRLAEKLKQNPHIKIRPVNMKNLKSEMAIIRQLYNDSWQKNWGFSPMTENEMNFLANNLKNFALPEMVLLAFYDGKPAGLSVTLPDLNQVLKYLNGKLGLIGIIKFFYYRKRIKGIRALLFGFKEEYRRLGLPVLLFYETEQFARSQGYEWCELSWNLEDNQLINDFDCEVGGKIYKRYRVVEKSL